MDWTQHGLVAMSLFGIGASLGSFLNVCLHRIPAGLSVSRPPSRCPRCLSRIGSRDNVPILGWLMLRGRCRACSLPISARYPLVEALCGGLPALAYLVDQSFSKVDPLEAGVGLMAAHCLVEMALAVAIIFMIAAAFDAVRARKGFPAAYDKPAIGSA